MVTGIQPTTSGLLDQRRSCSDNQAPYRLLDSAHLDDLNEIIELN